MTCGVTGFFFDIELAPCPEAPTEALRFRCARGHMRDRPTCAGHAAVLMAGGDLGSPLCRQCFDAGYGDVPIVPIGADEVTWC